MKVCFTSLILFSVSLASLNAQDPGFRAPSSPRQSTASQGSVSNTGTSGTLTGASVLTSMEVLDSSRTIQPGYMVSIRILEDRKDAVSQNVAVTGEVQVPYIGLVRAAGKTCKELAYSIKKDLEKSFFISATVVIAIDKVPDTPYIHSSELETYTMFGFVLKQGKYDLPASEDVTISQAILRAGGFAQFADKEHVKVVRTTPSGEKTILVDVTSIMVKGQMQKDIYLRKNDVVIIPEKTVNF
jgi:polysaccharide export outer membrane protein